MIRRYPERPVDQFESSGREQINVTIQKSEERFRAATDALLDGFAILSSIRDETGRIVDFRYEYINEAGCRLNRKDREEHITSTMLELFPNRKKIGLFSDYVRVVETGKPHQKEVLFYEEGFSGGKQLGCVFDLRAVKFGDGLVLHWREVTERKRLEKSETEQRILAEALAETAKILNSTLHLDKVLEHILTQIDRVVPHDAVHIMLIESGVARIVRARGYAERGMEEAIRALRLSVRDIKNFNFMEDTGQPIAIPDTWSHPDWLVLPESRWIRSYAGAPLLIKGQTIGFINVNSATPGTYSEVHAERLQAFADQAATAIENARLLENEQDRTTQLARTNSFILALGHVATRIEMASDPKDVLATLGDELRKLGLECLVALRQNGNQNLLIRYLSSHSKVIAMTEKFVGFKLQEYPLSKERFFFYTEVVEGKRGVYSEEPMEILAYAIPGIKPAILKRFLQLVGLSEKTRFIFLPLIVHDKVIGSLWMWGENLQESDLPAASIFASQVAISLENASLYHEIKRIAITDELTGLYNRRGGLELGQREFKRAIRHARPLSAILIDVDHFKTINDTYGHTVGDQVLVILAERCRKNVRVEDVVTRYGGEEFLIILPDANLRSALGVAERLVRQVTGEVISMDQGKIQVTISVGVAEKNDRTKDLMEMIEQADQALYKAKQSGRNQVKIAKLIG